MESTKPTQLSGRSKPPCGISTSNSVELPPGSAKRESIRIFLHGMRGNKLIYGSIDFRRDQKNLLVVDYELRGIDAARVKKAMFCTT